MFNELFEVLRVVLRRLKSTVIKESPEVDILDFIQSGEDDEGVSVLDALQSKILNVISWNKLKNANSLDFFVIDGSSRLIRGRGINLGIASTVIFSPYNNVLIDYPPYFTRLPHLFVYKKFNSAPFIGLQLRIRGNPMEILHDIYTGTFIRVKSFNEESFYDSEFNTFQMLDEIRFSLETAALKVIADLVKENVCQLSFVAIDGPIYPTPRVCFRKDDEVYLKYKRAYKRLIEERIKIVEELEKLGVGVIGIVKRLSDSYKLYRNTEINRLFSKLFGIKGHLEKVSDDWIISEIAKKLRPYNLRFPIQFGPFKLEISDKNFNSLFSSGKAPEKILFYIHMPFAPYFSQATIIRIEMLSRTFEMFSDKDTITSILSIMDPRRGVPAHLSVTDRLSRITSARLFLEIASILENHVTLPYETRLDIEQMKQELSELLGTQTLFST